MAKLGRLGAYEIPGVTLTDCAEAVTTAYRAFGPSFSREALAGALALRGRGGWFAAIVGSLHLWGLVEGRGTLKLTEIGVRIARADSPQAAQAARKEAVAAVPILEEIVARSPSRPPERIDLALMLAEITGADAGRVHSNLRQIRRILIDAWPGEPASAQIQGDFEPAPGIIDLSFSGGRLSLPETIENLEMVAALLQRRARELDAGRSGLKKNLEDPAPPA